MNLNLKIKTDDRTHTERWIKALIYAKSSIPISQWAMPKFDSVWFWFCSILNCCKFTFFRYHQLSIDLNRPTSVTDLWRDANGNSLHDASHTRSLFPDLEFQMKTVNTSFVQTLKRSNQQRIRKHSHRTDHNLHVQNICIHSNGAT